MTHCLLSSDHGSRGFKPPLAECESPGHERLMLLELATDLENWPARNIVFRLALDRAAQDLVDWPVPGRSLLTTSERRRLR